jgi:hypothetical protein
MEFKGKYLLVKTYADTDEDDEDGAEETKKEMP